MRWGLTVVLLAVLLFYALGMAVGHEFLLPTGGVDLTP